MKYEELRKKIEAFRDLMMRFSGSKPRGKRAGALYVGLIPPLVFSKYPFDEAVEVLKTIDLDESTAELMTRLGTFYHGTHIMVDVDGSFQSYPTSMPHGDLYHRALYELKVTRDGWIFPMKRLYINNHLKQVLQRLEHHALTIRLGAKICIWCGQTYSIPLGSDAVLVSRSHLGWVLELSEESIIHLKCQSALIDYVRTLCLRWMNSMLKPLPR